MGHRIQTKYIVESNVTGRVLERKNQKRRFFLSKSMPKFNFAKLYYSTFLPYASEK